MSTSGPLPVELGDVAPSFTPSFGRESDESLAGKDTAETNTSAQNRHQSADGSRSADSAAAAAAAAAVAAAAPPPPPPPPLL